MANIVLIDDDSQFRRAIQRSLETAGHAVSAYEDGRAAIEHLAREVPDLLITDIFMPEMEGLETIRKARAAHSKLPIIAISGSSSENGDYLSMARAFGATASLAKPFRASRLVALVTRILQSGAN